MQHVAREQGGGKRAGEEQRVLLLQALKVGALAAETLEQEGGVRDRQLIPAVDRRLAFDGVAVLRKLAGHLVW